MNAIIHVTFLATGEARIGNRLYRWDFDDYCGPTFVRADGEPLKRQPGPRHKVWKAFGEWLDAQPPNRYDSPSPANPAPTVS